MIQKKPMANGEFTEVISFICDQPASQAIDRIRIDDRIGNEVKRLEKIISRPKTALSLNSEQLAKLIKFFTLIERRLNSWQRMSVTVVPTLLEKVSLIDPDEYPILVDWVYRHKHPKNLWLPFGASKYAGLQCYDHYREFIERERARALKHDERQSLQQKEADNRRRLRQINHSLRKRSDSDKEPSKTSFI
jgi:hypothetical protein